MARGSQVGKGRKEGTYREARGQEALRGLLVLDKSACVHVCACTCACACPCVSREERKNVHLSASLEHKTVLTKGLFVEPFSATLLELSLGYLRSSHGMAEVGIISTFQRWN